MEPGCNVCPCVAADSRTSKDRAEAAAALLASLVVDHHRVAGPPGSPSAAAAGRAMVGIQDGAGAAWRRCSACMGIQCYHKRQLEGFQHASYDNK